MIAVLFEEGSGATSLSLASPSFASNKSIAARRTKGLGRILALQLLFFSSVVSAAWLRSWIRVIWLEASLLQS